MLGKLNNELSLECGELVTDVGLQCLISVTWVNTNNGGETLNTYDEINIIGLAERNFFRQHKTDQGCGCVSLKNISHCYLLG